MESKHSALQNQASLVASSLSPLGELRADEVRKVMELLGDVSLARVLVTDEEARIVYDSVDHTGTLDKYVLFSEVMLALEGKNVFHARLQGGALASKACIPVVSRSVVIGAVYLYEFDRDQAALVDDLRMNLWRISAAVCVLAILMTLVLGLLMGGRLRTILDGIRSIGAGRLDTRIQLRGRDELKQISSEINALADRLERTEAMRQRFVSDASHELKTPLAAITLLSDSIVQNDGMDRATIREFVYDIGREAERLSRVTQRLLELTRLEKGGRQSREAVDVKAVSAEALKMLRGLAQERDVSLDSRLDENCWIYANADDVHQVVFNLVENAVKYNVRGGKVMVLLFCRDEEVCFVVDDTGEGVPEEKLPFIFDRFFRVDESRTGEQSGSGLGLSIVKDTVMKHGGSVQAENREAGGMRFSVRFPLYTPPKEVKVR